MTLRPALARYDQVLLDLDGCVWIGDAALEGAPEAVAALRDAGKAVAFLTNDVRHAPEEFVRKLWRLGFQAALSEVVTVGSAIQYLLSERDGGAAYVVGSQALVERCGYHIEEYQVSPEGTCPSCGNRVPGRWDPRFGGQATDHPFSPYDRTRRLS